MVKGSELSLLWKQLKIIEVGELRLIKIVKIRIYKK